LFVQHFVSQTIDLNFKVTYTGIMNYQEKYIHMLQTEFNNRKIINDQYSLRAFARDLGIEPSRLSLAFSKKRGFSYKRARSMISSLKWTDKDKEVFLHLVEASHSRSKVSRKKAIEKINQNYKENIQSIEKFVDDDIFKQISRPIHYQIIEALKLDDLPPTLEGLEEILKFSKEEIQSALKRLVDLDFIIKEGKVYKVNEYVSTTSEKIPSMAIRQHHSLQLKAAMNALGEQDIDERIFSSLTIALPKEILPEIFEKIVNFRKEINTYVMNHENQNKDNLYCLSTQFFRVSKEKL